MLVGAAGSSRFHFGSVAQFCLASIFSGSAASPKTTQTPQSDSSLSNRSTKS